MWRGPDSNSSLRPHTQPPPPPPPYWVGRVSRQAAVDMLEADGRSGCFLLRHSSAAHRPPATHEGVKNLTVPYALSVFSDGKVRHVRIMKSARRGFWAEGEVKGVDPYDTVEELVEHKIGRLLLNAADPDDYVVMRVPVIRFASPPVSPRHSASAGAGHSHPGIALPPVPWATTTTTSPRSSGGAPQRSASSGYQSPLSPNDKLYDSLQAEHMISPPPPPGAATSGLKSPLYSHPLKSPMYSRASAGGEATAGAAQHTGRGVLPHLNHGHDLTGKHGHAVVSAAGSMGARSLTQGSMTGDEANMFEVFASAVAEEYPQYAGSHTGSTVGGVLDEDVVTFLAGAVDAKEVSRRRSIKFGHEMR